MHPSFDSSEHLQYQLTYFCQICYVHSINVCWTLRFNNNFSKNNFDKKFKLTELLLLLTVSGIPGEPVEISSEEDIFDYIDYPYRKPEDRNGWKSMSLYNYEISNIYILVFFMKLFSGNVCIGGSNNVKCFCK